MKAGHGLTGKRLQALCAAGKFQPLGDNVLLEAILAENAYVADDGVDLAAGVEVDARKAVAFRVVAVGAGVPASIGLEPNDVVMNISISGERIDGADEACPWFTVRLDHLVGHVKAADAWAPGYLDD